PDGEPVSTAPTPDGEPVPAEPAAPTRDGEPLPAPTPQPLAPLAAPAPAPARAARTAPTVPAAPPASVQLPPPLSVRTAPAPLRPLRYELRRAAGTGTALRVGVAVIVVSALTAVLLARIGHTPQPRLLAAWPRELPLP